MSYPVMNYADILAAGGALSGGAIYPTLIPASSSSDYSASAANTATIAAAVAIQKAMAALSGTASRAKNKAPIILPAGPYALASGTSFAIDYRGFSIRGMGKEATTLFTSASSAALFDFGTFSATPSDLFGGSAQNYSIWDMTIIKPDYYSLANHGGRSGHAIRDNGSGTGDLQRLRIGGFGYGINCTYGSDFMVGRDIEIELCDVGLYQGPGSQQFEYSNLNIYLCREGAVLDRPGQGVFIKPIFNSCALFNTVFEAPSDTTTRQLSNFSMSGTSYQSQIDFIMPWYESNAGNQGDAAIPNSHVAIGSGGSDAYRDIKWDRPFIVSGRNSATNRYPLSFISTPSGLGPFRCVVDTPVYSGTMNVFWQAPGNDCIVKDARVAAGYTAVPASNSSNIVVIDSFKDSYALFNQVYGRVSAMPTTGTYTAGSTLFLLVPTVNAGKILLGYLRLTTGSNHVLGTDWQGIYATTS